MSRKTLELVIHEKVPGRYGRESTYNSPDGFWAYPESHVDGYAQNKRLTDAELAAETYKAEAEFRAAAGYGYDAKIIRECDRKQFIFGRFATLPNYDEAQS